MLYELLFPEYETTGVGVGIRSLPTGSVIGLVYFAANIGCTSKLTDPPQSPVVVKDLTFAHSATLTEPEGPGVILYRGLRATPARPEIGHRFEITHVFEVVKAPRFDYEVFVHGEDSDGQRVLLADHHPQLGKKPTSTWTTGTIVEDTHRIQVPDLAPEVLKLYVGLYRGARRMRVHASTDETDGQNRILAAVFRLAPPQLPKLSVHLASSPMQVDGLLDEPSWSSATPISMKDSLDQDTPGPSTTVRLLYDQQGLYAAFEASDSDITDPFADRDAKLYEHEAVELFLMPEPAANLEASPYFEFQASPKGLRFDASFEGRRKGMNLAYTPDFVVKNRTEGTLNDPQPDTKWVSEWFIAWKSFPSLRGTAPSPGTTWRMNAFRIDRSQEKAGLSRSYLAWSPPVIGDFHNVLRFGYLHFGGPIR
jgi:hypothetical protein